MAKKPIKNGDVNGLFSGDSRLIVRALLENKQALLNILKKLEEMKEILKTLKKEKEKK